MLKCDIEIQSNMPGTAFYRCLGFGFWTSLDILLRLLEAGAAVDVVVTVQLLLGHGELNRL